MHQVKENVDEGDDQALVEAIMGLWTPEDEQLIAANIGEAGSQAKWEVLAALVATSQWRECLDDWTHLVLRGDPEGVLREAVKQRGKCPIVNIIVAELGLLWAPTGKELVAEHIWSERNLICDKLSRGEVTELVAPCMVPRRHSGWRLLVSSRCTTHTEGG